MVNKINLSKYQAIIGEYFFIQSSNEYHIMKKIQEKAEELLSKVKFRSEILESNKELEITDEIEKLMDEIEKKDKPYSLTLNDPDIYLKLSLICYSNGRLDRAESWIDKSLRAKKSYLGFLAKGKILQKKNDLKGALGEYDQALKYGEEWTLHKYRYQVLKERDMSNRALNALERALEMKEDCGLLAKKADMLMDIGKVESAKEFYRRAYELDPKLQNKEKKIDELLKEANKKVIPSKYNDILKLDEKESRAWLGKAECYRSINQTKKAMETLKEALNHTNDQEILKKLNEYEEEERSPGKCSNCGGHGKCPYCKGSGDCKICKGSGNCLDCEGTSRCSDCEGTGKCENCNGEGRIHLVLKCKVCSGSGICQRCEGYGTCTSCEGLGNCELCGGNGNCERCQGSGSCKVCGGKGI